MPESCRSPRRLRPARRAMQNPSASRAGSPRSKSNFTSASREAMREERRNAADRAGLAFGVVEREVAFGRRIEFQNLRDAEPALEILPDVRPQAVAAASLIRCVVLARMWRRVHQIAAKLADILEQRAVPCDDVVPELPRRKFLADHHRAAARPAPRRSPPRRRRCDTSAGNHTCGRSARVSIMPANQKLQFISR